MKLSHYCLFFFMSFFVYGHGKNEKNFYELGITKEKQVSIDNKVEFKKYAREKILMLWHNKAHVDAFFWIIQKESKWNPLAQNIDSTAYGIGQFLDKTWRITGYKKSSDPFLQIDAMIIYIKKVYGNPISAKNNHHKKGWY